MYDNICKYLAEMFPQDFAQWLLGQPVPLTQLPTRELAVDPIQADSLILLQSQNLILHLEFQTRPNPDIPFRMLDYWVRLKRKFPERSLRQFVIYLTPSQSSLVYQNYYQVERTRHEFDILRLWELEPTELLAHPGTLPLAVLAGISNPEAVLQAVADSIEQVSPQQTRRELTAASYVLAGLVLSDNVIRGILRSEMMRESATFQAILEEGRQEGRQEGARLEAIALVSRLLQRKFGSLSPLQTQRIESLSLEQLEVLGEALLDFESPVALDHWLEQF